MNKKKKILLNWWADGQSVIDYGLLSDLVSQALNGSTNIKLRLAYSGVITGNYYEGVYNPATAYNEGERVSFSASAFLWFTRTSFQAGVATGQAPNPLIDTLYWVVERGAEMIQDMGDGTWMRYTLGFNQDDLIRWGTIQRGTLSTSRVPVGTGNFNTSTALGASGSTLNITAVPATYTPTLATGLTSIFSKINLGASSSSVAILGTGASPVTYTVTLPTGQSLVPGDVLKLENTSSNFNVAVVCTYESSTGSAKIEVINGVGSGTYTSWTVYKCSLINMTWDAAPTFVYNMSIVDTYDIGTGASSITSFVQLGTGSRTTWTIRQGRTTPPNQAGQGISIEQNGGILGQYFTGVYKGTSIAHQGLMRIDATAIRYTISEGANAGQQFTIDMHGRPMQLSGSSGTANVVINGVNYLATFSSSLVTTAANFVTTHAATLAGLNITVAASGSVILIYGTGLTSASVSNVSGNLAGSYSPTQVQMFVASDLAVSPAAGYKYTAVAVTSLNATGTNLVVSASYSTSAANVVTNAYFGDIDVFTSTLSIAGRGDSSGEIAWNFIKEGSGDDPRWVWDHNQFRVCFGRNRSYIVDGVTIDTTSGVPNQYAFKFQPFTTFRLTQSVTCYHPQEVSPMAIFDTVHEFTREGLFYDIIPTKLQNWAISTGYVNMIAYDPTWWNKFITDEGVTFTWPGGTDPVDLAANQIGWQSALHYSTNVTNPDNPNFVLASYWEDTSLWRTGLPGVGVPKVGYSDGMKLYPEIVTGGYVLSELPRVTSRLYAGHKGSLVLS